MPNATPLHVLSTPTDQETPSLIGERASKLIERADQGTLSADLSTSKRATFRQRKTRRK